MSEDTDQIERSIDAPPADWRETAQPRHLIAGEALAWAMATGEWDRAALIWEQRLSRAERACLLGLMIRACAPDDAVALMDAALADMAPGPSPYRLGTLAEEANWWATTATLPERKLFLMAAFASLSKTDRIGFLRAAQKKVLE